VAARLVSCHRSHAHASLHLPSLHTHTYLLVCSVEKPSPHTPASSARGVRGVGVAVRSPSLLHFRRKREPVTRGGSKRVGLRVASSMRCAAQGRFLGKTLLLLGRGVGLTGGTRASDDGITFIISWLLSRRNAVDYGFIPAYGGACGEGSPISRWQDARRDHGVGLGVVEGWEKVNVGDRSSWREMKQTGLGHGFAHTPGLTRVWVACLQSRRRRKSTRERRTVASGSTHKHHIAARFQRSTHPLAPAVDMIRTGAEIPSWGMEATATSGNSETRRQASWKCHGRPTEPSCALRTRP
jgi:hypothetical protein